MYNRFGYLVRSENDNDNSEMNGALRTAFWTIFDPGHREYVGCGNEFNYYVGAFMWSLFNVFIVIILVNLCVAMMDNRMSKLNHDRDAIFKFYRFFLNVPVYTKNIFFQSSKGLIYG